MAAWLAPLAPSGLLLRPQLQVPDLGARMAHALQHAFAAGHRHVAIVGTDVPDLTATVVQQALQALNSHQAVFGPAEDGGFYLLALSTLPHNLFEDIAWSTSNVLAASVANAQHAGLTVAPLCMLPKLLDIDTFADLQRWAGLEQQQPEQQQPVVGPIGQRSVLRQVAQRIVQQTSEALH